MATSLGMRQTAIQTAEVASTLCRCSAHLPQRALARDTAVLGRRSIAGQAVCTTSAKRQRTRTGHALPPLVLTRNHTLGVPRPYVPSASRQYASSTPAPLTDPSEPDSPAPLPFLPRPLGVATPPTTLSKTWQQKKEELMDQDLRLAKRRELVREATQGYFHDYNAMRKEGGHAGKTWVAPSVLIREDRALYMPNISGTCLANRSQTVHTTNLCRGKVSLVVVLNTRISEEHVNSFVADALEDWEGKEGFAYVQINHQPNPLKSLLLTLTMSTLRRTMRKDRWQNYMFAGGEWGGLKKPLGISNKHVGYVYLVDPNLKIRWAGCGYAESTENEGLRRALGVLMGRWKDAQSKEQQGQ